MHIKPTVFREYDIRGIAGSGFAPAAIAEFEKWYGPFPGITITLEGAEAIGKGFGTIIRRAGGKRVVVGRERRPFADELTSAFIRGTRSTGCDVTDLGESLTPIAYFTTACEKFDGGVNVTGSHNVYFYNGFKMMKRDVWPIFGEELQRMREMIEAEDFVKDREGVYELFDGFKTYKKYYLDHIHLARKVRMVLDTGNGSAGLFAPELFRALGCEVIEQHTDPDPSFPNHVPDPEARQNMVDLCDRVRAEGAELGIGLDADGDRVGFVNERGEYVDADSIILALSKDILLRNPGKKILFDVKCTQLLLELIPTFGGVPLMHHTGHAPIKQTMRQDEAIIFGAETSGHMYFVEDYFKIDDGLFAAGRVLELYAKSTKPFSALYADFPERIRTPEIKLPCADEKKFEIVGQIQQRLGSQYSSRTIDGVRIQFSKTGWGLVRASNTSPYLTVRVEAESEAEVLKIKNILANELEKFPEVGDRLNRASPFTLTGRLGWV